jgi:glycolate oxidase iron-sulfur subunit
MNSEQSTPEAAAYDELSNIRQELDRCMKCGNCMAVCPVYATEKVEASVTRAKIAVAEAVLNGDLAMDDPQVYSMLFNCLVCKSCVANCPTKVNFGRIMLALRAALVRKNGLPWLKKMIFSTLKHPRLFDLGMKAGAVFHGIGFRGVKDQKAIAPRSVIGLVGGPFGMDAERLMPELTVTPLRDRVPEVVPAPNAKFKVAYFTGDALNYFYPDAGGDVIEVLTRNGVEVHIPKDQSCCGIPVLVHGDIETARTLARNNIDVIEKCGVDYLVTGCGSCGGAWKHDYKDILASDPVYGPKAAYWAERAYDISTFLTKVVGYRKPEGRLDVVVTYHDSCHLKKSANVFKEPREILQNIPGVTFKEMSQPDACCGSGGSYVVTHYETASGIGQRKGEDINQTGAGVVSTGCPACMMQLLDNVNRFGRGQKTCHYISLLAESYRKESRKG